MTVNQIANQIAGQVCADIRRGVASAAGAYDECYWALRMAAKDAGIDMSDGRVAHLARQMADVAVARAV